VWAAAQVCRSCQRPGGRVRALGFLVFKSEWREVCGHLSPDDRHSPMPEAASIRVWGACDRSWLLYSKHCAIGKPLMLARRLTFHDISSIGAICSCYWAASFAAESCSIAPIMLSLAAIYGMARDNKCIIWCSIRLYEIFTPSAYDADVHG